MTGRFATLTFERNLAVPLATLWQVWTDPAARQVWAPPAPSVTVEFLQSGTRVGGREVSLCKVEGQPDIRVEVGWLDLMRPVRSVNYEVVSCEGQTLSAALVSADLDGDDKASRIVITVQLSSLAQNMEAGYRQGFDAGVTNLAGVVARTMVLERVIRAPRDVVWGAWWNPVTLPQWWGPDGFVCRTARIDLRDGGEWLFDMIGPDGTVWPNHHRYTRVIPEQRIEYQLLAGEDGPHHAEAWVVFEPEGDSTRLTLSMRMATVEACQAAKGFGAVELGMQTLGKLARFVGAP